MIRAEPISTNGKTLTRKATFLTIKVLLIIAPVPLIIAFDMNSQGTIPQISHKKNGVPSVVGPALKPISKTNQITSINVSG